MVDMQDPQLANEEVETSFDNNCFDTEKTEMVVNELEIEVVHMLVVVDVQPSWMDIGPLVAVMNEFDVH